MVMNKSIQLTALAILGVAIISSCIQEKAVEGELSDLGRVSLVMEGAGTRSETIAPVQNYTYRLGTDNDGIIYTLRETVTELDCVGYAAPAPETRGTPAYTENVVSVHGTSFNGVVYGQSGQVIGDGAFEEYYGKWRRDFGIDPWDTSDPLTFFLRMPASPAGLSGLTYTNTTESKKMAFDYTSPSTASDQKDILFAIRSDLSRAQYKSESSGSLGGAAVLFRHALTGVKFAIGNNSSQNGIRTYITEVEFSGLKNSGHAEFDPDNTHESTVDDPEYFSSANSFQWELGTSTAKFSQTYATSDVRDFSKGDAVGAPDSFYAAGEKDNLNTEDASLTFWFIPQAMTDAVKVKVKFFLVDGTEQGETQTLELDLGTRILAQDSDANKVWRPGQLRTFTLAPSTVDVDITDEMENKTVKKNVVTRNTGNKPAYLRVAIVGNWVNASNQIVAPWDMTQGTFTGLGGDGAWLEGDDGFWYYRYAVPAGDTPSVPIFVTYTKPSSTPSGASGLVMDLTVQAIDIALGSDFAAAWAAAKGGDDEGVPAAPGDDNPDDDGSGE